MRILDAESSDFQNAFSKLQTLDRTLELSLERQILPIIKDVESQGDQALLRYHREFEGSEVAPGRILVPKLQLAAAWNSLGPSLKSALTLAHDRIYDHATRGVDKGFIHVDESGMRIERRVVPLSRAGIHVSGGRTSYPVSLLMGVVPAKVAGVQEVIVCSPVEPTDPETTAILAAAHLAGVDRFFRIGGVQAIAAMTFGTKTIPRVDLIAGWGNLYETTAKKLLQGKVGIDSFAGPSEICLMADSTHDPVLSAADLLAQAEHSALSRCFLITTDPSYAEAVVTQIQQQLNSTPRKQIIQQALQQHGAIILVPDWNTGIEVADALAPEHVMVVTSQDDIIASKIKNAGALFVGTHTAEALGDYVAGPNHTLPTGGTARFAQALSARTFYRTMSVMRASKDALSTLGPTSMLLAENEGLVAHAEAVRRRLKKLNE